MGPLLVLLVLVLLLGGASCLALASGLVPSYLLGLIKTHWRIWSVLAFILNFVVVRIPGRLDGSPRDVLEMPNLLVPAGYAFAIWGIIYLGEIAGMVWIWLPESRSGGWIGARQYADWHELFSSSAPAWCAANVAQCLWCISFRPWALDHLWLSACMLGTIAACLFACQRSTAQALKADNLAMTRALLLWPRSLHLGWTTAASLVNMNSYVGQARFGADLALCAVVLSILLAACIGFAYTAFGLPSATAAIAWAVRAAALGRPVGPDSDELGSTALRGLSHSENVVAGVLLTITVASVVMHHAAFYLSHQSKAIGPSVQQQEMSNKISSYVENPESGHGLHAGIVGG